MPEPNRIYLLLLLMMAALPVGQQLAAQSRSAGVSWSFRNISLVYEEVIDSENACELSLSADMAEVFAGRRNFPGAAALFSWNTTIHDCMLPDNVSLKVFAGPGAAAGWVTDYRSMYGIMFGIRGKAGVEWTFPRHLAVSVSVSPILGAHITIERDRSRMKLYRNGLMHGLIPEVGIRYCF